MSHHPIFSKSDVLMASLDAGLSMKEAAKASGLSQDAARGIASRRRKGRTTGPTPVGRCKPAPTPIDKRTTSDTKADRAEKDLKLATRRMKDLEQRLLDEDKVRDAILGLADTPAAKPAPDWLQSEGRTGVTGVPVTIWSDWHIGEVVLPASVGGINEYNSQIAEKRADKLYKKIIELATEHMVNPEYPGIVVCLGGDMVTGEIHDELAKSNDEEILQTVLRTRDMIIRGLRAMADAFGKVFVPCVSGNHGRLNKKFECKSFAAKNFDWLIYTLVERHFADVGDTRITLHIPPSNEAHFNVYGHRFLMLHGHDLGCKGGDGIIGSIGPIMRGLFKVGRQQAAIGRSFDTLLLGHWHQYIPTKSVIVNNCLKGADEFSQSTLRAPATPPSQALFWVHPTYGITANWEVFVDTPRVPAAQNWISWPEVK